MTRVFVLGCDAKEPNGGLTVMYRIVDILNEGGFRACVVQDKRSYRYAYSDNTSTPTIPRAYLNPGPEDLVVAPEWSLGALLRDPGRNWNIVGLFQMALFNMATLYDLEFSKNRLVHNSRYVGSVVVSKYLMRLVSHLAPGKPLYNIGMGIDLNRFRKRHKKRRQIALNVYKGVEDLKYLLMLIRSSKKSGSWRSAPIFEMRPDLVSNVLSQSSIYVSTSPAEGLGMLALEAMASEALVVGYDGVGGGEFYKRGVCLRAKPHDILDLLDKVECARSMFEEKAERYGDMTRRARQMVEENYNMEDWKRRVVKAFRETVENVRNHRRRPVGEAKNG